MRKAPIIITVVLLICVFGTCAYFAGGLSATIPPIRKYNCSGSVAQLGTALQKLAIKNHSMSIKISRRDYSTVDDGFRDMIIRVRNDKDTLEYSLVCDPANDGKGTSKSIIKLISAFNLNNRIGGYGIKAQGMPQLLNKFESDILTELKSKQGIIVKQDTSFWDNFSIY